MSSLHSGIKIVLGLAFLACPLLATANVGDTLPELRQRYGSAKDMGGQMLFEVRIKDGRIIPARGAADVENHIAINVYFDGDHSAMEIFTRNTSDPSKAEMTQDDVDTILTGADDGMRWNSVQLPTGKSAWVRSDNKLIARFRPNPTGKVDDAAVLVIMVNSR